MDNTNSYRRLNILNGKFVLTAKSRAKRPWLGIIEPVQEIKLPSYDEKCNLCPGTIRSNGTKNNVYGNTFVFINDVPSLLNTEDSEEMLNSNLFKQYIERGVCEVLCYTPVHNKTMVTMSIEEIYEVIMMWQSRYVELGSKDFINHVQIFETRGAEMGNSQPHPHGQIWAQESIPTLPSIEIERQQEYYVKNNKVMLEAYLKHELKTKERIIFESDVFVILMPFWADWPFETLILPKSQLTSIDELNEDQSYDLAKTLSILAKTYATFFERPLYGAPYMGIHQKPTDGNEYPYIRFHIHFEPPLLTPNRLKYQASYEKFAESQRDITVEDAAARLRKITEQL
ncbi:MAG TPA: galactose-1-phosphate uridylyltransferase [Candidatus Nitrosocosmicus sp.]|nr:galactose-1-phosphate uridylyltransferase [Candidatus Nitrosocosmicus sp.]